MILIEIDNINKYFIWANLKTTQTTQADRAEYRGHVVDADKEGLVCFELCVFSPIT